LRGFSFCLKNILITESDLLKCLGVSLDSKLSWEGYINEMAKKCYIRIRILYNVKSFFNEYNLIQIGVAMIMSLINYMPAVWGTTKDKYLRIIENVIRALARLVLSKRKFDPISSLIKKELNWLFPKQMCEYRTLCIMYKLVVIKSVPFFDNYFDIVSNRHNHCTRSANGNIWSEFSPKSELGLSCLKFRGARGWNKLPEAIRRIPNYDRYKVELKKWILSNAKV